MPIDGPVDHTGGRAGADGAESAAGRRGRRLRGRCVFARGAHRPVPAPAPAETARPEAKEEKAPKTEEGKAEEEICPAGYPDDPRPCKARPAGAGSLSAAAACAAAAAGVCLRRVGSVRHGAGVWLCQRRARRAHAAGGAGAAHRRAGYSDRCGFSGRAAAHRRAHRLHDPYRTDRHYRAGVRRRIPETENARETGPGRTRKDRAGHAGKEGQPP